MEEDELHTVVFPVQWDAPSWQVVRENPAISVRLLAASIGTVEARLAELIPDFGTRSALVVVNGVAANYELRQAVIDMRDPGLRWLRWKEWLAIPQRPIGLERIHIENDLIVVPSVEVLPEILGAAEPRTYTCDDCGRDLSKSGHAPDCPWK